MMVLLWCWGWRLLLPLTGIAIGSLDMVLVMAYSYTPTTVMTTITGIANPKTIRTTWLRQTSDRVGIEYSNENIRCLSPPPFVVASSSPTFMPSRRNVIFGIVPMVFVAAACAFPVAVVVCHAEEPSTAPYAMSASALLPAIRVRNMIDQAVRITTQIGLLQQQQQQQQQQLLTSSLTTTETVSGSDQEMLLLISQLQQLLLQKQNFTSVHASNDNTGHSNTNGRVSPLMNGNGGGIAKSYRDRYQENRSPLNLLAQPGALLVQSGEIATWKRLRQQEQSLEQNDEIRAAFNAYMNQIQYSTSQYTLSVPENVRKQMIRSDTLPDLIRQVVPSDMDLRTLYRNMVLTSVQDAKAELQYQFNNATTTTTTNTVASVKNFDGQELLQLLRQAQEATGEWFQMIDPDEIRRAELEEEELRELDKH